MPNTVSMAPGTQGRNDHDVERRRGNQFGVHRLAESPPVRAHRLRIREASMLHRGHFVTKGRHDRKYDLIASIMQRINEGTGIDFAPFYHRPVAVDRAGGLHLR
jgi:hypothetical protein